MLKIRLHILEADAERSIEILKSNFDVYSISGPYRDYGQSKYVRYYLDVGFLSQVSNVKAAEQLVQAVVDSKLENLI